jgi:hypothetical protein
MYYVISRYEFYNQYKWCIDLFFKCYMHKMSQYCFGFKADINIIELII